VGYDPPRAARTIKSGDSVEVVLWLENIASRSVEISHGRRFLFVEAQRQGELAPEVPRGQFARYFSWGINTTQEFPNPHAPVATGLTSYVLKPGEKYKVTEYHLLFPTAGLYVLRFCAEFDDIRMCSPPRVALTVQ
jgi:hypothetical protein